MRKILILLAIIISSVGLNAQTDYYWYKGQKVFLEVQPNKKYILFESVENNTSMSQVLGVENSSIKKMGSAAISKSIKSYKQSVQKDRSWAIVEDVQMSQMSVVNNIKVIYEANFYKTSDNKEAGLSHLFYVKLKNANDISILETMSKENLVEIVGNNAYMPLWYTLSCSKVSKGNALKMANTFYESGLFENATPDLMSERKLSCTTDTYFGNQWALNNTGQNGGTVGIDINFCQSRTITTGNMNVIVAVLDEGVETNHPDMTNMSGISYDTWSGTSPSKVYGSHGTACAGIIGANSNNGLGVSGIAPNCPLMPISYSFGNQPNGDQQLGDGISFAWRNGASVISNSWGGGVSSDFIDNAITDALVQGRNGLGCVVVFAAGNNNGQVSYPANSNPEIIAVAAASPCGQRKSPSSCDGENWWGSNYGTTIDIMAPGVLIPTTDRQGSNGYNKTYGIEGNFYQRFNGTSAACPHVAAVAALILSINPNLTQHQVTDIIENTAQKVVPYNYLNTVGRANGTWNIETGYGLLDANAAALAAQQSICRSNIILTETITEVNQIFLASNSIIATNTVASGAEAQYRANISVKLNNGFKANNGCSFIANLNGCSNAATQKSKMITNDGNSSNEIAETELALPVENDIANNKFSIYPNPAKDKFEVINSTNEEFTVKVISTSGNVIINEKKSFNSKSVNISNLPKGIYIVKVSTDSKTVTKKLIKL